MLQGMQEIASGSVTPLKRVYIHLWPERSMDSMEALTESALLSAITDINTKIGENRLSPLRISVILRPDEIEHDRFILSVKGGIQLGRGLLLIDPNRLIEGKHHTHANYLTRDALHYYHKRFIGSLDRCRELG